MTHEKQRRDTPPTRFEFAEEGDLESVNKQAGLQTCLDKNINGREASVVGIVDDILTFLIRNGVKAAFFTHGEIAAQIVAKIDDDDITIESESPLLSAICARFANLAATLGDEPFNPYVGEVEFTYKSVLVGILYENKSGNTWMRLTIAS